ncbi:hypothetical protein KSP39_PZI015326 [Platanthera zijinensis]|uniref:Carbohydrate kinase PfkB domain-containing protein n=1 Tax=Platanthera zijinensis TaxID=2320716 RepID=A0AAP0B9P6_9ASPA
MDTAHRRLRSVARHLLEPEISFADGIDTVPALRQSSESSSYPIVIIGGMVLDIVAKPDAHPNPGTTTPGKVEYLSGGVARNVAECMTKLGSKPFMISVVGFDMAGDLLLKFWESAELSTEGILKLKITTTPVVSNIFDRKGELFAAVASVCAVEKFLSPDWISKFGHRIQSAPALMVDANLHPDSLEAACRIAFESGTPVWFEPVSVTKSARIASIVDYVTCTSPNENELIAMANALSSGEQFNSAPRGTHSIQSLFNLLGPAIQLLMKKGIKLLVVTLGEDGLFLCFREAADFTARIAKSREDSVYQNRKLYDLVDKYCPSQLHESLLSLERVNSQEPCVVHFPALGASVVSLTGAGDCLVGGILSSLCSGLDIIRSTAVGVAMARAAVEAFDNVPRDISLIGIALEARQILSAGRELRLC